MTSPLLSALPLFPLGSVLFPGGLLPLRIFEVRYLDMIGKVHKAGAPFGVVSLTQGAEVRKAGAETERFSSIGTLAMIREFESPQAGLLQIECVGTQRFKVRSSALQKHGLWTAEVEALPDDVALGIPDDLQHTADALRRLVDTLEQRRQLEADDGMRLPVRAPYQFADCGWVANRWCDLLPLPNEEKHRLLMLDNPVIRLELLHDMLDEHGLITS